MDTEGFLVRPLPSGAAAQEVPIRDGGGSYPATRPWSDLEPIATDWAWLDALIGLLDKDFVEATIKQPEGQECALLNFFE